MRAMSRRLLTSVLMRRASSWMASDVSSCAGDSGGLVSVKDSARPTRTVSGVRKSCDSAASREFRNRSDSIRTSASCATST